MAGAGVRQYGMGSRLVMETKQVFSANVSDIMKAGEAIFAYRVKSVAASDPRDSHPMIYGKYTWANLPASEKAYYCDMAITAFVSFGIACQHVPEFVDS